MTYPSARPRPRGAERVEVDGFLPKKRAATTLPSTDQALAKAQRKAPGTSLLGARENGSVAM